VKQMLDRRHRLQILDQCLVLLEEALESGQLRVDSALGLKLRKLLGLAGLVPGHRLEGRRVELRRGVLTGPPEGKIISPVP